MCWHYKSQRNTCYSSNTSAQLVLPNLSSTAFLCYGRLCHLTPGAKKEARPKVSRQFETTDIFARNRHNISSFSQMRKGGTSDKTGDQNSELSNDVGLVGKLFKNQCDLVIIIVSKSGFFLGEKSD
jgi:hypothetical protein